MPEKRAASKKIVAPLADEKGGPLCARASLFFNVLASGEGMTYPAGDYETWLQEVGFESVETFRCQYEHAIVVGTKPG